MSVAVKDKTGIGVTQSLEQMVRPRVLHLINSFEIGGTERQAVELLKRLDTSRYTIRVAALHKTGPFYTEIASRFSSVPEFPLTSFYNRNAVRQLRRLVRLINRERVDILHAHDFYSGVIGAAAARMAGIKAIASQRHLKLSDRKVHQIGHRIIYRLAHRIVVNSNAIQDFILKEGNAPARKIIVIKNGIVSPFDRLDSSDYSAFNQLRRDVDSIRREARERLCGELRIDPDNKLVGMMARLQPVKGHRFFIEAAASVLKIHPQSHFVLVGDGPLRGEIEDQIARLEISDRVHLLGDRSDASSVVSAFDLAALASLHEGLPNAVMEAMAAGVPVVATDVGGTKELITDGETGYLVAPSDSEALASRIIYALEDERNRIEIAERAREFVIERFGIERMVESVERLYDELMSESTNRIGA